MMKIYMLIPLVAFLGGCEGMTQNQLVGTTGGAAIGAIVTPHNPVQGALIGGAVGLAAGSYLGRDTSGHCVYQRPDGSRYVANCP
jgi:hypothetical protein